MLNPIKAVAGESDPNMASVAQHAAGGLFPASMWDKMKEVGLVWHLKWSPKGATPVRPQIVLFAEGLIEPGQGFKLG